MTEIICNVLSFFRDLIVNYFPDISIGSGNLSSVADAFETMVSFIAQINFLVPLPTMFTILSLVYGLKIGKFVVFLVNWVIRRIADIIP